MAATVGIAPLSQTELQSFAENWYRKLDVHAPLAEFVPLLADQGLEMIFPEATVTGFEGFKGWYEKVICIFFDEVHTVKSVELLEVGEITKVKVVVKWEASVWNAPEPYSSRIVLDAYQTWLVQRSPQTQQPVVLRYTVDSLDYAEGSAQL
ncbi:MAG: hypothetical protein AAF716_04240 [Cyanobacteria bacterium P01_D01_bin.1]